MDWDMVLATAKQKMPGYCRVCPVCEGKNCSSGVPGMGGAGTGAAFRANSEALNAVRLKMKTMHGATAPSTTAQLFGRDLALPVMAAPMTGISYNMGGPISEYAFAAAVVEGSAAGGSLGFVGDGADPVMLDAGLKAIHNFGGQGVAIIKPREQEAILERLRQAEDAGAVAVGVDVDGAGLVTMALKGQPVGPKRPQQLAELVAATKLPFIVKGIMTAREAILAAEAGAAAIVVSNHGGRVLDFTPGVAEVLREIAAAVKGRTTILADGGVRSGVDAFKLLALGADGVLVGRPVAIAAVGGDTEGVAALFKRMQAELMQTMILTGCDSPAAVDAACLQ